MIRYAITDRRFFPGDERQRQAALLLQANQLAVSQVDLLQLREKDLSADDLLSLARALRADLPRGSRPRLLLNATPETAAAASADGVHLPGGWVANDLSVARSAFQHAGLPRPVLSVSAHTLHDVEVARDSGADLILFGPVFEKRVCGHQVQPGVGLAILAEAAVVAGATPLLALGGIDPANIATCLASGAAGIAGIRLFLPHHPA